MNRLALSAILTVTLTLPVADDAFARGGAPWLDSPGYQRALHESRKRPRQELQPQPQHNQTPVIRRKKKTGTQ